MAYNLSTTADITQLIPMIYEKARMTILEKPLMRQLVSTFNISGKAGNQITIPKFGTVTAGTLTENLDMQAAQTIGTTGQVLSVSEAGAQTFLTDASIEDASEDVIKKHGEILGNAIAQKDDKDGLGLFSTLTTSVGGAAVAPALSQFTAAQTLLRNTNATGEAVAVYHPFAYHALAMTLLTNATYGTLMPTADEIGKKFRAKELLSTPIFESGNIALAGSAGTQNCVNAMFTKECFARVDKRALRIEKERDASKRGYELNATTRYGWGKPEDTMGVKILSLAVTPS